LIDEAGRRELTIREALSLFCEREIARKDERRIVMSIGLARFPFVRDLAGFDFPPSPRSTKSKFARSQPGDLSPMPRWCARSAPGFMFLPSCTRSKPSCKPKRHRSAMS
jgi:hypothetical protein